MAAAGRRCAAAKAARSSSVNPVVPTTTWMPWLSSAGTLVAGSGGRREVDDDFAVGGAELGDVGGDGDPADDLGCGARVDGGDELEDVVGGDGTTGGRIPSAHRPRTRRL